MGPPPGTPTAQAGPVPPMQRRPADEHPAFPLCARASTLAEACHGLADDLLSLGYDLPSVYLLTGQRLRCHAARGYFQVVDGFRPGTGVIGRVVQSGVAELIADVRADPTFIAAVPGLVAEACTPVVAGGSVVGAVSVESRSVLPSDAAAVLAAAAHALGLRIEVLGMPSLSPAQRLAHVAVQLTAAATVDELAQRAVAAAVDISGMSSAALARVGQGSVGVTSATGPLAAALQAWTAEDLALMASWVGSDTSSHFPGGEDVPPEYAFLRRSGARAVSVQPLVVGGVVHGLLIVADEAPVQHAPAVVDSLELLAAQTAASLGMALVLRDVSRRAARDELTGLRNRMGFGTALDKALTRRRDSDPPVAVLLLDLDDFKHVNDSLGHQAGDRLLVAVAAHLRAVLRGGDVACRLGGDEFVVVLPAATEQAAEAVAERLLDAVSAASAEEGRDLGVTGSVGIALTSQAGSTAEGLLRAADLAMYLAKERGKGRCALFVPEMQAAALRRMDLTRDLRRALREGTLHLAYQPIVDVQTGRVTAVEALCRWRDEVRGDVPPSEFVPLAEENGDVVALGEWVLREACRQLLAWDADGAAPDVALCVNVSTRQLERPGLLDVLDECLAGGVAPSRLVLEITETALADDAGAALRALHAVRARGLHVAVDDFGTGYSSLARLRTAPVSRLKVDRSFVSEIGDDGAAAPIVDATVAMARGLGLGVVAEGVETPFQLAHLRRLGCHEAQGFLLTRPLPPGEVLPLLRGDVPWTSHFPR